MDDYDAVMELWRDAGLPSKPKGRDSRGEVGSQLRFEGTIFLVAEREGRLVGSLICTHDGRKGWMNRLAVRPDSRRKGIGGELVREGERRLREAGLRMIAVLIEEWNGTSMEVFQSLGYRPHEDIIYLTKREGDDV
jgi:ribosomal protein S18 acetylase RimI-like enzyme